MVAPGKCTGKVEEREGEGTSRQTGEERSEGEGREVEMEGEEWVRGWWI